MANTQGGDKVFSTPWTADRHLRLPAAIPATSTIYYAGQAVLRDVNGNMTQCDDTQKGEFVGITVDFVRTQVDPTDQVQNNGMLGDKMFLIEQPLMFTCKIAAAQAGDEGRKVFWLFNNEVTYGAPAGVTLQSGNLAGEVWYVRDATHVTVVPPWMLPDLYGSSLMMTLPATGAVVLTKFDHGKTFLCPATAPQTITLPPVAKLGSGDEIVFVYTGATAQQITLKGNAAETINGSNTYLLGTAPYSRVSLMTDGTQWYVVGT